MKIPVICAVIEDDAIINCQSASFCIDSATFISQTIRDNKPVDNYICIYNVNHAIIQPISIYNSFVDIWITRQTPIRAVVPSIEIHVVLGCYRLIVPTFSYANFITTNSYIDGLLNRVKRMFTASILIRITDTGIVRLRVARCIVIHMNSHNLCQRSSVNW